MPTFLGLLLAPALALGTQSLMFALVTPSCSVQTRLGIHVVALVAFMATALLALLARRDWRVHARHAGVDAATQGPSETRRFLAASATAVASLSALLVLVMWFAAWMLSPCWP
jgi:hypothetical protein